jgi:SM-20-related protein
VLLEKDFEVLISSFIENKVGVSDHFLSDDLSNHLKQNLLTLFDDKLLVAAGTGNAEKLNHNNAVRSDSIFWLDRKHNNLYENQFFDQVEDFIKYLNMSCYAGITDCEFHYSLYEIGCFYKKHLDQFQNNESRQYSLISYLNADWQKSDGGELMIHQTNNDQTISPLQGKTVFFKSNELVHEVLVTKARRMSVTGWLKRDQMV